MEIFVNVLNDKVTLVVIKGDFTIADINLFDSVVFPIFDKNENNIVLNMANLTFIDSFGIGKLFSMLDMAKLKGKHLYIMNIRENIKELFNTLKLLRYYSIIEPKDLKKRFRIRKNII